MSVQVAALAVVLIAVFFFGGFLVGGVIGYRAALLDHGIIRKEPWCDKRS